MTDRQLLLFSAGLDSFPAWHYLGQPPALYVDIRHRYRAPELQAIAALADRCGINLTISTELDLSAWHGDDVIIPMRNVFLAMIASRHADAIWCIGVKGDHTLDKSPDAFEQMSQSLSSFAGRPITIASPFWDMTKTDIVAWYLAQGLPADNLLLTFSCTESGNASVHCGTCPSCLRRWIALANNNITTAEFASPPWQWHRVTDYYLPAMRAGRYPEHRAAELVSALATVGIRP
ncbi:hypothetical protein GCM10022225_27470 [Plantactinospora mayteni]|uniref:7-cyano-7-deazaguanine synthase n=1 Tax=Plantactinospora mayteni TaxID=566021 RepID=A0ABQ4EIF6_9ACTN|nr:7-cyano-7-deazaguanine synthase [Plantactinospora mayteni]GIG94523.1 hypothetical protein Pma05_10960 [Plantactinospora mayteni]